MPLVTASQRGRSMVDLTGPGERCEARSHRSELTEVLSIAARKLRKISINWKLGFLAIILRKE